MKIEKIVKGSLGFLLFSGTLASPIPGDEFIGVPVGLMLMADAFKK